MILPRWRLCYFPSTFALSFLTIQCAALLNVASNCDDIQILSDQLQAQEAEEYCRYALSERSKVETWWGATWTQPIRIHVSSSYRISRALTPAYQGNSGFMEMPLAHVRSKTGALLHEVVHIYAPNDNRFLAEGLAVYLQERLGGNPAFPNFIKEDFSVLAGCRLSEVRSLEMLHTVRTPQPLSNITQERTAYILAGSFVGFLIEKYGLPRFQDLYRTGNYDSVFGKNLATLETEWRTELRRKVGGCS